MGRFAIIGLGAFGVRMLEELLRFTDDIIILDKDSNLIKKYERSVRFSCVADVTNHAVLSQRLPAGLSAAIIDLGSKIEASILVTAYLKKIGVKEIVVKAVNDQHESVLTNAGATNVIFPDREAAKRVMPMMASVLLFNFMPISSDLALAEVGVNTEYVGKTLIEANLRKNLGLNVVAVRKADSETFNFINDPDYRFAADDILLLAGSEEHIFTFSRHKQDLHNKRPFELFKSLFPQRKKDTY